MTDLSSDPPMADAANSALAEMETISRHYVERGFSQAQGEGAAKIWFMIQQRANAVRRKAQKAPDARH